MIPKFTKKKPLLILIIITIGFLLRIINLEETAMFLGDQGRDAIIVKRIVTLEHLPAIGPPSSVGQVYLGPFYYYLIAPFLLLFKFNPVGLAFAVAFYSSVLSFIIFLLLKDFVSEKVRFLVLFFSLFSPILLEFSRFSWNPNLLPYFSFLTMLSFLKWIKTKEFKWAFVFGTLIALTLQLHYSYLFILPIYAIWFLVKLVKSRDKKIWINTGFTATVGFLIFFSPLILFDLKHNFLNTKNFLKLTKEASENQLNFLQNLTNAVGKLINFTFSIHIPRYVAVGIFLITLGLFYRTTKNKRHFTIAVLSQIFAVLLSIAYFGFRPIPHYFGSILLLLFLAVSIIFKILLRNLFVTTITIIFLNFVWIPQYKKIIFQGNKQIEKAKYLAKKIYAITDHNYQLIALPPWESTGHIRYFLEIWGKRPLPEDTLANPDSLIVICFKECPNVEADPQWQIAAFKNKKIDKIMKIDNLTIVKIVHETKTK